MAELWGMGPAEATAHVHHASRMPTRYLGGTTRAQQARRRTGLSGALPRVPAVLASDANEQAAWMAFRATQRRRRLLAIFARMMARFHERHERHWSMGRWDCAMCHKRIAAWAWLPLDLATGSLALHEECVSHSMWDVVLHHERLAHAADV
jgi:hypothetical protein